MDELERKRKELLDYLIGNGILRTKSITDAFREVPRHNFVPQDYKQHAYDDIALPTVSESTISQPSTVAIMLEHLQPEPDDKVLEIGTGSGWQACLLSKCVRDSGKVTTIEIDEPVFNFAKMNIVKSGAKNIKIVLGDGSIGYTNDAPYDKIIYTAATPEISPNVIKQLKVGGRIVAPIGTKMLQQLTIIDKISAKKIEKREEGMFQFILLKGKFGFN